MELGKYFLVVMFLGLTLTACGGGGGNTGGSNQSLPNVNSSVVSLSVSSSSVANSSIELQKLTRTNTPLMAGGLVDLIGFSKSIPDQVMNSFADISNLQDGKYSVACDNAKSTYTATISKSGKKLEENFTTCIFDGIHYSGARTIEIDTQKSSIIAVVNFSWIDFKVYDVATPTEFESLTGSLNYEGRGPLYIDNDNKFLVRLNLEVHSSTEGALVIKQGVFNLTYPNPSGWDRYGYYFSDGQALAGTLSLSGVGAVSFSAIEQSRVITLAGAENTKAYIDPAISALEISLDENGDGRRESNVSVATYDFDYDIGLSDLVHRPGNSVVLRAGATNPIPQSKELVMGRGGHLLIDISKLFAHSSVELLDYDLQVDGFDSATGNWVQTDLGVFDLTFSGNIVDETYKLTFIAKDQHGVKYELFANLFIGADFDRDNIPDAKDQDDDNDGVSDYADKFPFDPLEQNDFDKDGIGDNSDPDNDNDGVANIDDAYPRDAKCSKAAAGDGNSCYASYSSDLWFMDSAGIVYSKIYVANINGNRRYFVNRWDSKTGVFIKPTEFSKFDYHTYANDKIFSQFDYSLHATDLNTGMTSVLAEELGNFSIKYIEKNYIVITRMLSGASESEVVESYSMSGELLNSVKVFQSGQRTAVIAPRFSHLCGSYITTNSDGVFEIVLTNRYTPRCFFGLGDIDYSSDGMHYFTYVAPFTESAIYSSDRNFIVNVDVSDQLSSFWTKTGFVVANVSGFTFYRANGETNFRFSYPQGEEYVDVVNNIDNVALLTRNLQTGNFKIRVFDKDLDPLLVADY